MRKTVAAALSGAAANCLLFELRGDEMSSYKDRYTDLQMCLEDILRDKGKAAFRDGNQIAGMVRDLMPGKTSDWNMIRRMADCGILQAFVDADKGTQTERERAIHGAILKLVDLESIDETKARHCVNVVAQALGWTIPMQPPKPDPKPQPKAQPKQQPQPKPSDIQSNVEHPVPKKKSVWQIIGGLINLLKKSWFLIYAAFAVGGAVVAPITNPNFSAAHVLVVALFAAAIWIGYYGKGASFVLVQKLSRIIRRIGVLFSGAILLTPLIWLAEMDGVSGWPQILLFIVTGLAGFILLGAVLGEDI